MPKKIHKFHDCKKSGCVGRVIGQVISGVRKKDQVLEVPGQPNVEVVYGVLIQCVYCKIVMMQEMVAPKSEKPSEIISAT
jgi:hypothetical protein